MAEIPRPPAAGGAAQKVMGRFRCEQRMGGDVWLESWRARVQGLAGFDQLFSLHCLAPGALARRPHAAESLLRAARSTAAIKDPRLASIQDSGLAPGSAYVATELVRGVTLRELAAHLHGSPAGVGLPSPPLPPAFPAVLAYIAAEIAAGLAAAHAQTPVPHGALSPTAVMVTPQAGIKIVDLGLRASVLTPQEIAASPSHGPYAAPELSRGETPLAADLYSLGRVMAGLGGGGTPGRGADAIRALPAALQNVARQLLAEDPRQRPKAAQAEEMLRAVVAEHRGVDVRTELGRLVQQAMQSQASRPPAEDEAVTDEGSGPRGGYQGPSAPPPTELFADEPTAIMAMSADGRPAPLASLLANMQSYDDEHTDRVNPPTPSQLRIGQREPEQTHGAATPLHGVPVVGSTPDPQQFDFESPTVMTSAVNLPIPSPGRLPVSPGGPASPPAVSPSASGPPPRIVRLTPSPSPRSSLPSSPPLGPRSDAPSGDVASGTLSSRLPLPSGTPLEELKDLTTEEISASLSGPIERAPDRKPEESGAIPAAPGGFSEFPTGVPFDGSSVTPTGWRPNGPLEEPVLAGERPGSLGGIEIPGRKRPRKLVAMAVGGAGLMVLVITVIAVSASRAPRPQRPVEYVAAGSPATPGPIEVQAGKKPAPTPAEGSAEPQAPAGGKPAAPGAEPRAPEQRPTPAERPTRGRPVPTRPPGTKTVAATPPPAAAAAPAPETREQPREQSRELEIRSNPSGATVVVAGKERGTTPLKLQLPADVEEIKLVRPGYEPRTVKLAPKNEKVAEQIVDATLDPAAAPAQPPPAPTATPAAPNGQTAPAPSPAPAPPAPPTP